MSGGVGGGRDNHASHPINSNMRNTQLVILAVFCLAAIAAGIVYFRILTDGSPSVSPTTAARPAQPELSPHSGAATVNFGTTSSQPNPVPVGVSVPSKHSMSPQFSNNQPSGLGEASSLAGNNSHATTVSTRKKSVNSSSIPTGPSVNGSQVSRNSPGYANTPGTAGTPESVQEIIAPDGELPPVAANLESDPNASPTVRAAASNIANEFYKAIEQTGGQSDSVNYADKWAAARFRADESLRKWLGEDGFRSYTMNSYRKWLSENP